MKKIAFIGSAFGHGAQKPATALGPLYMKNDYELIEKLLDLGIDARWHKTIRNDSYELCDILGRGKNHQAVLTHNKILMTEVERSIIKYSNELPIIIGGDHSCAIGTWLGAMKALNAARDFGLLWIDAHMDAHTYNTSPSRAYHGMPLSVLLGCGGTAFSNFLNSYDIILNPNHLVLIGIRSYENEEENLLRSLGVKVIKMDEINIRGLISVFDEALSIVTKAKKGFGISFDLDAIDPKEAPGVGSPEPGGLQWHDIHECLPALLNSAKLKVLEIAEFNPKEDYNNKTAEIIFQTAVLAGKINDV